MQENIDVRRFMLLSAARTGSNLLLSLLSTHSSVKTYGELFNLDTLPPAALAQALEDPIGYLRQRVYNEPRPGISAVGFKMFYDHLTEDYFQKLVDTSDASEQTKERFRQLSAFIDANYEWPTLQRRFSAAWEFLIADRSLAVIHLRRRNLLASLVSLKTAYTTRQWWKLKDDGATPVTVHLEADECRRYFQKLDAFGTQADRAFEGHPKLDVDYEDLVRNREETLRRIFTFLAVPYEEVSTRMKKQIVVPASESVANYSQLKASFEGTNWSAFFE